MNFLDKPAAPAKWTVDKSSLRVPEGWGTKLDDADAQGRSYHFTVSIPAGAKAPHSPADAVLPFPSAAGERSRCAVNVDGYEFVYEKAGGIGRSENHRDCGLSARIGSRSHADGRTAQVMVPEKRAAAPVDLFARVRYHGTQAGQRFHRPRRAAGLERRRRSRRSISPQPGDQLVRYVVTAPAKVAPGAYALHPYAKLGDETFRTSVEPIPTLPTRNWSQPADVTVHVLDLDRSRGPAHRLHRGRQRRAAGNTAPDGHPGGHARRSGPGVRRSRSHYDAIVVGIRAYELRPDRHGREFAPARLRAEVAERCWFSTSATSPGTSCCPRRSRPKWRQQAVRVTDQNSPVRFLAPENPLLNSPNKITLDDFKGWEQERGLYFWSTWDPRYQPVLGLTDPGEPEATRRLGLCARWQGRVHLYRAVVLPRAARRRAGRISAVREPAEPNPAFRRRRRPAESAARMRSLAQHECAPCDTCATCLADISLRAMLPADSDEEGE